MAVMGKEQKESQTNGSEADIRDATPRNSGVRSVNKLLSMMTPTVFN